ncbi:2015_t:CDS:2 [Funneliformis geosporum]|uniref:8613_t:CDS:1 n=1 Tax=Funneliformis geosporum TaxID=1117311 RepID=A0A9W4SBZ8_9GLOM|nr:2015_t:CDS:2 [Funneliformis geosporum]CAI2161690.1 8613_t:CDS:2 [Funneliformis geosporum]
MPMIEQLKNFIRHGKQAIKHDNNYGNNDRYPKSPVEIENFRDHPEIKTRVDNSSAIQQIVAEEREQRNKMPTYPGLERYHILDKMGDGAFSNVYRAFDTLTQEKVAIKVVRKHELNHSQSENDKKFTAVLARARNVLKRSNILKEVQIMRQLKHPSIVSLLSFSESPDYYYLVLELMEGGELFHQIVKLTYFSEQLSRHVIVQVAEGIRYLHEEKGVVHRDIKPENLLFEPIPFIPSKNPPIPGPNDEHKEDEGEFIPGLGGGGIGKIKIADFGLSKIVWDEQTMTPCGTVGYTAPEIVKDERYSKSVDMWALGCVLYTMLCGFPPFYDESINDLTDKVVKGQYTFLSPWWDDISASSKDLISNLLAVDPEKRYTINQFFDHPWVKDEPLLPKSKLALDNKSKVEIRQRYTGIDSPLVYEEMSGENFRRQDILSPGISLKEALEVTYAVHRMEEENAKRRKMKISGHGGKSLALNPFKGRLHLNDEDDDNGEENSSAASSVHQVPISGTASMTNHASNEPIKMKTGSKVTFMQPTSSSKRNKEIPRRMAFELSLDGATLLCRRKKALGTVEV